MYTLETNQINNQIKRDSCNFVPVKSTSRIENPAQKFIAEAERLDQQGTYDKLNSYFNEQDEEHKKTLEGRSMLGIGEESLTDEQVITLIGSVQYLVDTWLEEFERTIFGGKTLQEVFNLGKL